MTENPYVERFLDDPMLDDVDHALGRPLWPLRETKRNYFGFPAHSDVVDEFDASPYWRRTGLRDEMVFYDVTDVGRQALVDYLSEHEKHVGYEVTWNGVSEVFSATSSSQAKYLCFLNVRNAFSNVKFVDFVRNARVRKAA